MFDWYDYLKLAKKLKQQSVRTILKEAYLRSTVSRAYYALYHIALDYACSGKIQPVFKPTKKGLDHVSLAGYYRERGRGMSDYDIVKIGVELGRLYNNRKKCDYDNSVGNIEKVATVSLGGVESALNFIPK